VSREAALIREMLAEHGARPDLRLFRNASSKVWVGKYVGRTPEGHTIIAGARQIMAGLAVGSADLVGIKRVPVALLPQDGHVGVFLSAEVKARGTRTEDHQHKWRDMVSGLGGISGVVKTVEELGALLERVS